MSPRRPLAALACIALPTALASACGSDDATSNPGGGGAGVGGAVTGGSGGSAASGGASGGLGGSDAGADSSGDSGDAGASDASACTLTKPYSSKNATCNACAEQECCASINACYADQDCDDGYVNCILACALLPGDAGDAGVASCLSDCATQYPKGKTEYDAAIACADAKCAGPCG